MEQRVIKNLEKEIQNSFELYKYSHNISEYSPFFPEHVHIEPTNSCNLRCIHCHHSTRGSFFTKKRGFMKYDLFCKIIDQIKGLSSKISLDNQGEPLLHPNIVKMIEYAKKSGFSVSLLTNATRLNSDLSKILLDLELDRIVFSFEGSTKELHETYRIGSKYIDTLKNILNFIKLNYDNGRKTFICMSMVVSSYTKNDIEKYQQYFNSFPINTIFLSPLLNLSGASKLSSEINMEYYSNLTRDELPICRVPWQNITVNWDGSVSICPLDYNGSHIIGDVNNESLVDMFNGEPIKKYRISHIKRDYSWIDEQGVLCGLCNCKFDPEYDLQKVDEFLVKYIVRQAQIAAPSLLNDTSLISCENNEQQKYNNLVKEIDRMESI